MINSAENNRAAGWFSAVENFLQLRPIADFISQKLERATRLSRDHRNIGARFFPAQSICA
jgi:hypothetical protein